jgi:hypothetical protein
LGNVKNVTRDIATANGDQDITGFGFNPKSCVIFTVIEGELRASWGLAAETDSSKQGCIFQRDTGTMSRNVAKVIQLEVSTISVSSAVASFIPDGIRLGWTKDVDGPTGIALITVIGFK